MNQANTRDNILLLITLVLLGVGLVMVFSASTFLAEKRFGSAYYFIRPQVVFAGMGLLVMLITSRIPYQFFIKLSYLWLFIALAGLVAVFAPQAGVKVNGASRWISIGFISGQPSEFAKFALVTWLAYSLANKKDRIREFWVGFFPHIAVAVFMAALIVVEPDLGAAVTLGLITVVMLFAAGVRLRYLGCMFLLSVPVLAFFIFEYGFRMKRITAFLAPWSDPLDSGYHIIHSFYAFAAGGLTGAGPGAGLQKLFFLPEPHTDFIFSVVGEELGFIGVAAISLLFLWLVGRGVRIALNAYDLAGTYLALGLTLIIGVQAFMNMYVVTGLLPTKGLTLPFFSYGGSSLLMNLGAVGILLNIASQERRA